MGSIFKIYIILFSFLFVFCDQKMDDYQVLDKTNFQTSIEGKKTLIPSLKVSKMIITATKVIINTTFYTFMDFFSFSTVFKPIPNIVSSITRETHIF